MTTKEKAKKLHEIADALEEWGKYSEKVTNAAQWRTPEAKLIIRQAITLLVDNLVLLNECKNQYGLHSPLQQCFLGIEQVASLPQTTDFGDYRGWTRDFTERHLWGGEKRSLADECIRYANKVDRETQQDTKTELGEMIIARKPWYKKRSAKISAVLTGLVLITTLLINLKTIKEWFYPPRIQTSTSKERQLPLTNENKLSVSLKEICKDIDSRPLAQQSETEKQYLGLRIKREPLKVLDVEINPGDESIYNLILTFPDQPTFPNSKWRILCTVSKDQYPQLRIAREGMEFYVSAEIEMMFRKDTVPYIDLSNVTLEFE